MDLRKFEAHLPDLGDLLTLEPVEVGLDRLGGESKVRRQSLESLVELQTYTRQYSADEKGKWYAPH